MKKIFSFLIIIALLVVTHGLWLPYVGTVLLVPDEVHAADAIFVLRGDEFFRMRKAAELQKQGLAPRIVTSTTPKGFQAYDMVQLLNGYDKLTEAEITLKMLAYFGVPKDKVLLTDGEVTSTYEEALAARALWQKKGFKSMLLVTSTYHMKRSLVIFRSLFSDTEVKIHPVTAKNELYRPAQWWTRERDVRRLIEEYGSIVFNWIYHFVLKKRSTAFDTI